MPNCPQCGAQVKAQSRFCRKCGVRLAAAGLYSAREPLPMGTRLQSGRYEVVGQLGQGGMGAVYLARDNELFGRLCVAKQMQPLFATQSERRRAEDDFRREAEVLTHLNRPGHPRIPEVYGFFVEGLDHYLVMKYIEGESLERRLERLGRPLAEAEVVRCAAAVADALVYLHSRRPEPVIHRDIKPANIIVDPEDRVWLVDFGLARAATSRGARMLWAEGKTVAAGTPGYTPLEQWQMKPSVRSDIYALGATMHHLLTGQDPRDHFASLAELDLKTLRSHSRFDPVSKLRPDLSSSLSGLVSRCLAVDSTRRPAAQQLKVELGRLVPTGSRLFATVTRWSPTLGEILGVAAATFVRMLLGRTPNTTGAESAARGAGASKRVGNRRPRIQCLYCRGQGITRNGRICPICGGLGYW